MCLEGAGRGQTPLTPSLSALLQLRVVSPEVSFPLGDLEELYDLFKVQVREGEGGTGPVTVVSLPGWRVGADLGQQRLWPPCLLPTCPACPHHPPLPSLLLFYTRFPVPSDGTGAHRDHRFIYISITYDSTHMFLNIYTYSYIYVVGMHATYS